MRLALCLEQTLGHRAHARNVEGAVARSRASLDVLRVEPPDQPSRLPWALDGSWRASRKLRASSRYDAVFFHTQSVSLFAPRHTPYVVSLDATPVQVDTMGAWYNHRRGSGLGEAAKRRWYRSVFGRAAGLVTWSEWAARSLVADYGADASKVLVAHPGAGPEFFSIPERNGEGLPTILFVGGDFHRKGGDLLLRAFETLRGRARLILVTGEDVGVIPGVETVSGATPGSQLLLDAYARADIFCLPTRGDCTPVVLGEAMAAGLPVVTTGVGSNSETVRAGTDGLLVAPGDGPALDAALGHLIGDPGLRLAMGRVARDRARERFDAAQNADRVLAFLEAVAA
jgi:glycosyltransferase involved in cell wall biosynthesis